MKMKHFLLIPIVLSLFSAIAYRSWFSYVDQAIGINAAIRYRTNANISAILTVLIGVVYISLLYMEKAKKKTVQGSISESAKKADFEREIHNILSKLVTVAKDSEYERDYQQAKITIEQINKMNKYVDRFNNLYIGEGVDVFDSVVGSLELAKRQLIQNSKSIVNRIIIEGCENEIEKRVANNQKLIEDVKALLNETVNYLDNKTATSSSPLENITASLKILNETIF